jgi:hypothetical protein
LSYPGESFEDLYDDYPREGPRSYAEYKKEIQEYHGIPLPFSRNPHASYEEDYAYELAYERYMDETDAQPLPRHQGPGWQAEPRTGERGDTEPDFEAG